MVNTQDISSPNRTAASVEILCEEMSTPPNHGRDSGFIVDVLNHCEGSVVVLSTVLDKNVPLNVIRESSLPSGAESLKIKRENLNMAQ